MSLDTKIELIQSWSFFLSILLLFPYLENGMLLCVILIRLRKQGRRWTWRTVLGLLKVKGHDKMWLLVTHFWFSELHFSIVVTNWLEDIIIFDLRFLRRLRHVEIIQEIFLKIARLIKIIYKLVALPIN